MGKPEVEGLSRDVVIAAARRLLEHSGEEGLSFRGVARDLGVTAPALYAYVEDKQELLAAVATEHFALLAARFSAIDPTLDPLDRIRLLSRAYIDHALVSPALFHLMFRYPPTPTAGVDAFPPATQAFDMAAAAAADAVAQGELRVTDPQLVNMTMWAAMHGVAEVLLMGFGTDAVYAETLIDSVVETMIAGLSAPTSVSSGA